MRFSQLKEYKNDSEKIVSKGTNTKLDFAYYFPQDLTNNLAVQNKDEETNQNTNRNYQDQLNEQLRDKVLSNPNGNKIQNDNEYDRSYYKQYNNETPYMNIQVI